MTKSNRYMLLLFTFTICLVFITWQYFSDVNKHERLAFSGKRAEVKARHFESSWGVDYVNYYFITEVGQRIEGNQKCGNDPTCLNKYATATVIYIPNNPNEYEFSFDFDDYSLTMKRVFYFIFYLPIMTFAVFAFVKFSYTIISSISDFLIKEGFVKKKSVQ